MRRPCSTANHARGSSQAPSGEMRRRTHRSPVASVTLRTMASSTAAMESVGALNASAASTSTLSRVRACCSASRRRARSSACEPSAASARTKARGPGRMGTYLSKEKPRKPTARSPAMTGMPSHEPSRRLPATSRPYRERTSRSVSRNRGRPSRTASAPGWRTSIERRESSSRSVGVRPADATRSRCCPSRERRDRAADFAPRAPTPNATATSPTSRGVRAREKAEVTSSSFSVQVEARSCIVDGGGPGAARQAVVRGG